MGIEKGDTTGIRIEWKEVGIADNCVKTIRKIQTMTSIAHQLTEGRIVRRPSLPREGRGEIMEAVGI